LVPVPSRSLICAALSSLSKIEKPRRRPSLACSICRNFSPSAWKVQMVSPSAASPRMRLATRSRISLADLLVKVIAAIRWAGMRPDAIRWAIFSTMTRVLPLPALASTSRGPSVCRTAARWGGLRPCIGTRGTGGAARHSTGRTGTARRVPALNCADGEALLLLLGDERGEDHDPAAIGAQLPRTRHAGGDPGPAAGRPRRQRHGGLAYRPQRGGGRLRTGPGPAGAGEVRHRRARPAALRAGRRGPGPGKV